MNVVKPKNQKYRSTLTNQNSMNQSGLEANTCDQCPARENACKSSLVLLPLIITIYLFILHSHARSRKWREFGNQSQSVEKQNQSKRKISFDTHLKTNLQLRSCGGCFRPSIKPGTWNIPEHPGTRKKKTKQK